MRKHAKREAYVIKFPCRATSKRTGKPCRLPCEPFHVVCKYHGGRSPGAMKAAAEREKLSRERVEAELLRLTFSDIRKLFRKNKSGKVELIPIYEMDEDTARAIQAIYFDAKGEVSSIRMADKNVAIVTAARTLGMFEKDNQQLRDDAAGRPLFDPSKPVEIVIVESDGNGNFKQASADMDAGSEATTADTGGETVSPTAEAIET